jgi:hypothetical protein
MIKVIKLILWNIFSPSYPGTEEITMIPLRGIATAQSLVIKMSQPEAVHFTLNSCRGLRMHGDTPQHNYMCSSSIGATYQHSIKTSTSKAVEGLAPFNTECEVAYGSQCLKRRIRFIRIRFEAFWRRHDTLFKTTVLAFVSLLVLLKSLGVGNWICFRNVVS